MTKTFSPSEAAFAVFELTKRQPQFVLRYSILYALMVMVTFGLAGATGVGAALQGYMALVAGGEVPDQQSVAAVLSPASSGITILLAFGVIAGTILSAMALRKAVRDEDEGLFGLQLGRDEISLFLASLFFFLLLFGVVLIFSIVGGLVSLGSASTMILILTLSYVAAGAVAVRLCQFGVFTIATQRVNMKEIWAETKGQFWRFAGAYLLWAVIAFIGSIIAQSLGGIGAMALGVKVGVGMPDSLTTFLTPGWLLYTLIYGLASGFSNLGAICVGAYAWHQMRGNLPAPKEVF